MFRVSRLHRSRSCTVGRAIPAPAAQAFVRSLRFTVPYKRLPHDEPIEEERHGGYVADHYYPVYVGDILNSRYRVVCKLGCGATSTAWLCRDLFNKGYKTIKVCVRTSALVRAQRDPMHEIHITNHLRQRAQEDLELDAQAAQEFLGLANLRAMEGSFDIVEPSTQESFKCLVYEPLGITLHQFRTYFLENGAFPLPTIQYVVHRVCMALLCLHNLGVVHTDISPSNILTAIPDSSSLLGEDKSEYAKPAPCKILEDRVLYCSRILPSSLASVILSDFGEARIGEKFEYEQSIMPLHYEAPEVVMHMEWDCKVDIWSLALTAVGLIQRSVAEASELFIALGEDGQYCNILHLRQMHDLLGRPPQEFLNRSPYCTIYWDQDGNWIHPKYPNPVYPDGMEGRITNLIDGPEKQQFVAFLRRLLKWLPEDRPDAQQLFDDEWIAHLRQPDLEETDEQ